MKVEEEEEEEKTPPLNEPPPWSMRPFPYELVLKEEVPIKKSALGIQVID
jgi:transposase